MASSSTPGWFVAKMCRIRYLGGGFGFIPSARLTTRLTNPRGFFNPSISDSSAWSVPMPPPPYPGMIMCSLFGPVASGTAPNTTFLLPGSDT